MGIRKYIVGAAARGKKTQTHVHEVHAVTEGPMNIPGMDIECHSHGIAAVSGEMIMMENGMHRHELQLRTGFYEDHFHMICGMSGPNIAVAEGEHVHYAAGMTSTDDGHHHHFKLTSGMAEDPGK